MSVNSRDKGHAYERELMHKFRAYCPECVTSRSESKRLDDAGVDLCYLPVNVQAKAVERLGPAHGILKGMPSDKPNVLFHKRNRQGTVVSMSEEFFFELFELYIRSKDG